MATAQYTANPVADAERYYDALAAESEATERRERQIAKDIRDVLTKHIRTTQFLSLPRVRYFGEKAPAIASTPLREVISDEAGYGKPLEALMDALQKSDCPYVNAIRNAIADSYIAAHAADIAEASE